MHVYTVTCILYGLASGIEIMMRFTHFYELSSGILDAPIDILCF